MNKNKNIKIIKKKYRKNITDEQKQKNRDYQKEYVKNMTDEQKQKLKDYRKEYYKKYYAEKKLNNIIAIIYKIFKMIYHINNYKNYKNYRGQFYYLIRHIRSSTFIDCKYFLRFNK